MIVLRWLWFCIKGYYRIIAGSLRWLWEIWDNKYPYD